MSRNAQVEPLWLRLLGRRLKAGETAVEKIEDGYFAVVEDATASAQTPNLDDYQRLVGLIPDLGQTRAIDLNGGHASCLGDCPPLREWAKNLATPVENGQRRAFAVVDMAKFQTSLENALSARGWRVETQGLNLRVADGSLREQVNVLRAVVRMVLSRQGFAEASAAMAKGIRQALARDATLFAQFRKHFREFNPSILDHFFVVYPGGSGVALGWDYWQLSEGRPDSGERTFCEGLREIETLLQTPAGSWLADLSAATCDNPRGN